MTTFASRPIEPDWILFPGQVEIGGYRDPDMARRRGVKPVPVAPPVIGFWSILVAILATGFCTVAAGAVRIVRRLPRLAIDEWGYQRRRCGRWLLATAAGLLPTRSFCYIGG
jgi:hypothetical protein